MSEPNSQSDSHRVLPAWFAEAESLKAEVLGRLNAMSPSDRLCVPRPGEWSAAQIVEHLALTEELLVSEWHAAARASVGVKPSRISSLMVSMAKVGMSGPLRVPTIPSLDPNAAGSNVQMEAEALAERWASARERLSETIPSDGASLWIIHPIFGPLSHQKMGPFFVTHIQHHLNHWPKKSRK